jgi:hypothetical protein
MDAYKEHEKFKQDAKVVSTDSEVKHRSTTVEEDGELIVLNNDETKNTVTRQVEGKLAEDVRKRVKAGSDVPVFITEDEGVYWLSELTAANYYEMTVKCNGVEKSFELMTASRNFEALLNWLDEDPNTPIGEDVR